MRPTITFFILFLFFFSACQSQKENPTPATPRPVRVVQVKSLETIDRQYTGVAEATEFSVLAFKVSGTLTELNVEEGQKIKQGHLIARINPYDYQQQYNTAASNYNAAKSIYERNERLLKADATATQNVEIAQADYIRAGSAVDIARSTLDYTRLLAPFDGIVVKKYVANHEEVMVGQSIVKLVNPDNIEISFVLPETNIELLKTPKTIYVEFDSQKGKLFTSDIKEYIYSSNGFGIPITLKITDKEFLSYRDNVFPGFSCKITFRIQNTVSDNFIIPASALFREGDREFVWIVDPHTSTVKKQPVTTIRFDQDALVKTGLHSDNIIVTAGVQALADNQKVTILPKN